MPATCHGRPGTVAAVLLAVMSVQALLGLLMRHQYRDAAWITATWYGNDWVTLVVVVPLLAIGRVQLVRQSLRGLLLVCGIGGYAVYNYVFYLFGAALNPFFLLYVVGVVAGFSTLAACISQLDVDAAPRAFNAGTPVRLLGGYLVFVGAGLSAVWIAMWAAYAFADRPTPIEPEAFKVVAAVDLTLIVPLLVSGGIWLWRQQPWGYVIAPIAAIQGALYLLVLTTNSIVMIDRGFTVAPGELPVWVPLTVLTTVAAIVLLRHASRP